MKKLWLSSFVFIVSFTSHAQSSIENRLSSAFDRLENDRQMVHASVSFTVGDADDGKIIFQKNGSVGLSPASSQKIFTSIASYSILGQDFHFKTIIGYTGKVEDGVLNGNLILTGYGDPTLGSWRYDGYKPEDVEKKIFAALAKNDIRAVNGDIIIDDSKFTMQPTPGGWPWNDMGNYYGAPNWGFNWLENQYDITYRPASKLGETVSIVRTNVELPNVTFLNNIKTGHSDEGDNSYVYLPPYGNVAILTGSIPYGKNTTASGSVSNPPLLFAKQLQSWMQKRNFYTTGSFLAANQLVMQHKKVPEIKTVLDTLFSPNMDQMMYYFLHKSINLYGESFAKYLGFQEAKDGATDAGVQVIRDFWEKKDIGNNELKMMDGSGLSPQNYVTSTAEVKALLFAQKQNWFDAFYKALPDYNGTKMKSGTIHGCKAYAGYQTSKSGKKYVFSLIINNYDGGHDALVQKMYQLLNVLK